MGVLSPADFEKEIRTGRVMSVYYIYGRDSGRVGSLASAVKKLVLGPGWSSSDLSRFDGRSLDMSELLDAIELYPMFSSRNFIEINDLDGDSLNADELKQLISGLGALPEQTVVLISITGFDVKGGKKTPGAKNKKIIDACAKAGSVCEADLRRPAELTKYISELAEESGCVISRQSSELLAQMCLGNTLAVENEMGKLCAYAGSGEITSEMIEQMVAASLDTNAFALASAVSSFNSSSAFKILDELMQQKTEGVVLISALSSAFMDLYRAAAAIAASVRENEAADDFGYKGREFVMKNAFRDSRKTNIIHLRNCLKILCNADLECKSTRLDQKIIIQKAIAQMLSAGRGV